MKCFQANCPSKEIKQAITYSILNENQESITALLTGNPMELDLKPSEGSFRWSRS